MKRALLLSSIVLLAACGDEAEDAGGGAGGPPPPPPYQMRAELPGGDRLAAAASAGEQIFSNRCGTCHLAGGMATNLIAMQRMEAGESPETALLTARDDLEPDYIRTVVRQGKVAMPPISRVETTDAELDAIVAYLTGGEE